MTEMKSVTYHGLHLTEEGVWYLHQNNKACNFITLKQPSPFKVIASERCPHAIDPNTPMPDQAHWKLFLELYSDEFTKTFLPVPRARQDLIPFLPDANNDKQMFLLLLSRFSSPIHPVVVRFDKLNNRAIEEQLGLTNLAPLILTNIETKDQKDMEIVAGIARRSPRRLILVGDSRMVIREPMIRMQTYVEDIPEDEMYSLPMEKLGAVAMRRFARGEQIDSPWTRREAVEA